MIKSLCFFIIIYNLILGPSLCYSKKSEMLPINKLSLKKQVKLFEQWCENNPDDTLNFYKNYNWFFQNSNTKLCKLAFKNYVFLNKHPEITFSLYNNIRWIKKHPQIALDIYRNIEFLKKHPTLMKKLYTQYSWIVKHPQIFYVVYTYCKEIRDYSKILKKLLIKRKIFINKKRKYWQERMKRAFKRLKLLKKKK